MIYNKVWNVEMGAWIPAVSDKDYKRFYTDESKYILVKFTGYYNSNNSPIHEEDFLLWDKHNIEFVVHYSPQVNDYFAFSVSDDFFPMRLADICSECSHHGTVYGRTQAIRERLERDEKAKRDYLKNRFNWAI